MTLVNYVKYYKKEHTIKDATDKAVTRCINENILKDILLKNRAEVMNMVITEFNEEVFVKGIREEGREEGQNSLIEAIERLRNGESKEEIIASGIDEHTVELAEGVK